MSPSPAAPHNRRQFACRLLLAASLAVAAAAPTRAADAAAFAQAAAQFQHSNPSGAEIDAAAARWQALAAAEPADPVLRAYAGAATARQATTTWLPWRKLALAEDGLAQIDKALAQLTPAHDAPAYRGVPASLEVRFVAANTFVALPGFFNRGARGDALLAALLASPLFDAAPLPFRAAVWLKAGEQAAQAGQTAQARTLLTRAAHSATPVAGAAQARLGAL